MVRWNVYSKGRLINGVFYTPDCDGDHVKSSLIEHDGYPENIVVKRVRGVHPQHKL